MGHNTTKAINAAIIGASGYTGAELIRLLQFHPFVTIKALVANQSAGNPIGSIYPHFQGLDLPDIVTLDAVDLNDIDIIFSCLPHATAQAMIASFPEHIKIIDLSADFRLRDPALYETWYGTTHLAPDLQKEAVYGLSEIYADAIASARLVACPGCYPTGATLPLIPLVAKQALDTKSIIIDAKTGVTGAGRAAKQAMLFSEVNEGITPYAICSHRHMPEMEQSLSEAANKDIAVTFTPQLVPMSRGILSTIYVCLTEGNTANDLRNILNEAYKNSAFISILPEGKLPATRHVHGTNNCHIQVLAGRLPHQAIIVSAIDNLTKGSSGQAVQNLNLMMGWDETTGLQTIPVFP